MSALGARARAIYGGWAGRVEDRTTAGRQRELDALRLVGVLGVVLGHWLVTAVVRSPDGSLRVQSPLASMPSLTPVSWALQTLAVFFLVGGFAAARSRRRASGYGSWLRGRLVRLWRPAAGLLGAWALATVCLAAAGVPPRTLRTLLTLVVSPLWFLVVFSAVSAATPLLMAAARRTGLLLVVGAVLLVAAVDVARFALGAPHWTGYLNLAAGWSVPFGLGVLWESGRLRGRVLPLALLLGGAAATALLILLAGYPASMVGVPGAPVSNLNPPTLAAVCFGAAQCGAAMLLAPRLARAMRRPAWWAPVAAVNLVALPVFLWHQTAMLLVTSTGLRFGGLPGLGTPPESGTWVLARLGWLPVFLATLTALLTVRARTAPRRRPIPAAEAGSLCGGRPTRPCRP